MKKYFIWCMIIAILCLILTWGSVVYRGTKLQHDAKPNTDAVEKTEAIEHNPSWDDKLYPFNHYYLDRSQ